MSRVQNPNFLLSSKKYWPASSRSWAFLVVVILALSFTIFPIPLAQGATGESVNITGLRIAAVPNLETPSRVDPIVVLGGTYTNGTDQTIDELDLNLVSTPKIQTRSELAQLLSDATSAGNLITSERSAKLRNITPGSTKTWQITFRGEEILGLDASGVFGIGILPSLPEESLATVIPTPWFYNSDIKPTNVSVTIPLTTLNTHLANNGVPNQKEDLAEARRLTNLITNQDASKISWLQDVALVTWTDQLKIDSGSDIPEQLSVALSGLAATTAMLPYGHTDLTALVKANQQSDITDVINQTRVISGPRQIFYTPSLGIADRQTVSLLNQQGIRSIISNEFLRGSARETTSAVSNSASNPVLVHDLAASMCLSEADINDETFFKAVTCIRSEIAMMTAESPQSSRSIIVLAPPQWKISSERLAALTLVLSDNNWMQLTTLDLVAATESTGNYVASPGAEPREFTRGLIRQAQDLKTRTESVSALFDDQELAAGFTSSRLLGFSDLWSSNVRATRYLTENLQLLNTYLDSIGIQTSARITTPDEKSEVPITVVNDSDRTISVSIDLTSTSSSRFSAQPTGIIQVDSGQRVTVPVAITLVGAGIVDVQAQLVAPNGERFGEVENIQISSAAYTQFARNLVLGAFGLLVLLALSNFTKRRKDKLYSGEKTHQ